MEPFKTPPSLLEQLRAPTPPKESWERFLELFGAFLYECVRVMRVPEEHASEVVQEVFLTLLRGLDRCRYDPRRGRFRDWLRTVLRNQWRAIRRREFRRSGRERTGIDLGQLEEPAAPHEAAFWEQDYCRHLIERALALVRKEVSEKIWAAFERSAIQGLPIQEVARSLGTTVNAVWMARFRVRKQLRDLLEGFLD
jgi:RNA polymerase sigma-70 factor (ECF subfamily)